MSHTSFKRLAALREAMTKASLQAWTAKISDPHLSEYVPAHWRSLEWLTGFTGSTAEIAVTADAAALFVDSRYWEQAEAELKESDIEVVRSGSPKAISVETWLAARLAKGALIGVAPELTSESAFRQRRKAFEAEQLTLTPHPDLIDRIWTDNRPARPTNPVEAFSMPLDDVTERLARVRTALREEDAEALLLASLDDIAWLTGCRGADIDFNPVFLAHLIVTNDDARLYTEPARFSPELINALSKAGVVVKAPETFTEDLSTDAQDLIFLADPDRLSAALFSRLTRTPVEAISPVTLMKSRKSSQEADGIRNAMVSDGIALCEFYAALEEKLTAGKTLNECDVAALLDSERLKRPDNKGLSFSTIAAFGPNAALPHYSPVPATAATLTEGLLLIDSGGQYEAGTTDITRMTAVGTLTDAMKRDVTLVLKAHIALARAVVPAGTSGAQLDAIARAPLWAAGLDFGHGTGHGVGCRLNVHEGPFHISPRALKQGELGLQAGILVSDEPGLYRPGGWGVRIENLILSRSFETNDFGDFLDFEVMTLCPIDLRTIDVSLLDDEEKHWINAYHQAVRDRLSTETLSPKARQWLKQQTLPISKPESIR